MTSVSLAPGRVLPRRRFYVGMAATCMGVAVAGFAPTYWVPMAQGTLSVSPITHLHALFFYGWTLLFLAQSWLAASGRLTRHREVGVLGVAMATGMCFVGLGTAINTLKRFEAAGLGDAARPFAIVSVTAIALFAGLFVAAVLHVKRPDVHKRLMLVATISILQAAIGRWFLVFLVPREAVGVAGLALPPPVAVTLVPAALTNLLIVAAMIRDHRTRGYVHPAYWAAGAAVLAVQILRVPVSTTDAWARITQWLVAVAP
jgi:hypothetical protein